MSFHEDSPRLGQPGDAQCAHPELLIERHGQWIVVICDRPRHHSRLREQGLEAIREEGHLSLLE